MIPETIPPLKIRRIGAYVLREYWWPGRNRVYINDERVAIRFSFAEEQLRKFPWPETCNTLVRHNSPPINSPSSRNLLTCSILKRHAGIACNI